MSEFNPHRDFSPSAAFLLELGWVNLFELAGESPFGDLLPYRCKGCGAIMAAKDRERHHARHKKQEYARREKDIQRAREKSLAAARAARAARPEGTRAARGRRAA